MTEDIGDVPEIMVRRLPLYARALHWLVQENVATVSSSELGDKLGMSSAQIRKDLSYFGGFGKQGTGYDVKYLLSQLQQILGMQREWLVALVGVGNLGHAIARYNGFGRRGFKIAALFDSDPKKIGQQVGDLQILSTEALPMVDQMSAAGIRAILSYAPINLRPPKGVRLRNIDPVVMLQSMTYHLKDMP
jgi:redox-sensing transcriptional repressor